MSEEYERFSTAYQNSGRMARCPDDDAIMLERIEVEFAIPVLMTQDQQKRLLAIVHEITDSLWNTPVEGVHWMAGVGSKPHWSRVDAAMLGKAAEPDAPFSGEPTFDDSVYQIETCARPFVSVDERARVLKRRRKKASTPVPSGGGDEAGATRP